MARRRTDWKIGTLDFETDPFSKGQHVYPFAGCVYIDDHHHVTWGVDCVADLVSVLNSLPDCKIYAHNGGKFDFHFLLDYANRDNVKIINGRIAQLQIGNCVLIDSFLLMPFGLAAYSKTEIDYSKFVVKLREKNKVEIIEYLKDDCKKLHELLTGFLAVTGNKLTIGSAAFAAQKKMGVIIPECGEQHDIRFREFYFGGRCQAFKTGVFEDEPFDYVDINSAYPAAMLEPHPAFTGYAYSDSFDIDELGANFVTVRAVSRGAFPVRIPGESLAYPDDDITRVYNITGWELKAAIETDSIEILDVLEFRKPKKLINLRAFVETYYQKRLDAEARGDLISKMAYKFLLNSGYGKYATDPREFQDWVIADAGDIVAGHDYHSTVGRTAFWTKSAYHGRGWYDVATSASITGLVRANLWRAIKTVDTAHYCDTDGILCKSGAKLPFSKKLGEWKLEGVGTEFVIAGKKIYGVTFDENGKKVQKTACKGARLSYNEIVEVARGGTVRHLKDAPSFSVKYGQRPVERNIRSK